jgi:hypothetical protein
MSRYPKLSLLLEADDHDSRLKKKNEELIAFALKNRGKLVAVDDPNDPKLPAITADADGSSNYVYMKDDNGAIYIVKSPKVSSTSISNPKFVKRSSNAYTAIDKLFSEANPSGPVAGGGYAPYTMRDVPSHMTFAKGGKDEEKEQPESVAKTDSKKDITIEQLKKEIKAARDAESDKTSKELAEADVLSKYNIKNYTEDSDGKVTITYRDGKKTVSETLSRGSLYRRRYYGRY